jgi:hypothetical protein
MNLGDFMLSEISQSQKDMLCESTYMRHIEQSNSDTDKRMVAAILWDRDVGVIVYWLQCFSFALQKS